MSAASIYPLLPSAALRELLAVAPPRRTVRHWGVASGPALRVLPALPGAGASSPERRSAAQAEPPGAASFDEVFRQYAPYVGALVLKLIGRPGDVDDVVQDVFIEAHRSLSRLRDPAALRAWLRRITVRRARRWLRKRWVRRRARESDVDGHLDLADASASPEQRAELARLYRMLDRMPRDERLVWILKFAEGETLESMAALLGISVSTVQRRLRAAEALAESLLRLIR